MPRSKTKLKPASGPASGTKQKDGNGLVLLVMGALGVVYGDIGTSPLYTIQVCFSKTAGVAVEAANVVGVISLIIWALVVIVSIKYLIVILRADLDGEGGILALTTLACSKRSKAKSNVWFTPAWPVWCSATIGRQHDYAGDLGIERR